MAIPVTYNFRNLVVRKTTTLMTALGIALTVAVLLAMMALLTGLRATLSSSGDPLQILVMRKGSESELVSNFTREPFQDLKFKAGIARTPNGDPMASLEVVTVINIPSVELPEGNNVSYAACCPSGLRCGKDSRSRPAACSMRASAKWWWASPSPSVIPAPGSASISTSAAANGKWSVLWTQPERAEQRDLRRSQPGQFGLDRVEVLSSALVRATDTAAAAALLNSINDDQRLNMNAVSEKEYYALQTVSAAARSNFSAFSYPSSWRWEAVSRP